MTSLRSLPWWQWVLLDLAHAAELSRLPSSHKEEVRTAYGITDRLPSSRLLDGTKRSGQR